MDKSIDSSTTAFMHARKIIPLLMLTMMWGCSKTEEKPAPPAVQPQAAAPAPAPQMAAEAPKTAETPKAMEAVQPKPAAPVPPETRPAGTKPAAAAPAPSGAAAEGEKAYNASCMACHKTGVAGAPRLGDKADWVPRIKQGKDVLYKHTIEGFKGQKGMMPPRGGSALKDDQLKTVVDYMAGQSQ